MARIELYKNKINNMSNIIDNVRAEVSGYALALTGLYSKFLAINSSVVDNVISSLSTATKIQEEQISGLNATQRQIDAFVLTVQVTDNRVASCIRELTKMYEAVYNYWHDVSTDIATDNLAEWLYKNWGAMYDGDDLGNIPQEVLEKYVTYNTETNQYIYNWTNISRDLRTADQISYEEMVEILYTFVNENGDIDTKSLESYLEILATNGHNYPSTIAPDNSRAKTIDVIAAGLEESIKYLIYALKSDSLNEEERSQLISALSLNNIVIAAAKTAQPSEVEKVTYGSYVKIRDSYDNPHIYTGISFYDHEGDLCSPTLLQPGVRIVRTDKTIQELNEQGIKYILDYKGQRGVFEIQPQGNSVYTESVDINISEEGIHYYNNLEKKYYYAETGSMYRISSAECKNIVIDYSGDTDMVGDFVSDEYGKWNIDETKKILIL